MKHPPRPRLAWGLTGSGHFLRECLDLARTVYPRPIDLEHSARLGRFPLVEVVDSFEALRDAVERRMREIEAAPAGSALVSTPPQ